MGLPSECRGEPQKDRELRRIAQMAKIYNGANNCIDTAFSCIRPPAWRGPPAHRRWPDRPYGAGSPAFFLHTSRNAPGVHSYSSLKSLLKYEEFLYPTE